MRAQETLSFRVVIDKKMRIRKESNIINSLNHKISKINRGDRKEGTLLDLTRRGKPTKSQESTNTFLIIILNVKSKFPN
jgi:hypothetical protein